VLGGINGSTSFHSLSVTPKRQVCEVAQLATDSFHSAPGAARQGRYGGASGVNLDRDGAGRIGRFWTSIRVKKDK
jgi:hypothetical protein